MKKVWDFIKTTAVGGLLVIVPISIILFVVAQLFYGLYAVAQQLLADFGIRIDDAISMFLLAAFILIGICFLTGLLVQTRLGDAVRMWMSKNIARRIPMYNAIASLTQRFAGLDGTNFAPVEVDLFGSGTGSIGFLIEVLPDDRCVVFIPSTPVATLGQTYVVGTERITKLDASVADTIASISQWGVDTHLLYKAAPDDER